MPDGGRPRLHGGGAPPAAAAASRRVPLRWRRPGGPIKVGPDGRMGGVEPRDAAVRFDIGLGPLVQPRTLPTNVVCIYAPRFAEVNVATGANQTIDVQHLRTDVRTEKSQTASVKAQSRRLVQNQSPELARDRLRASGFKGRAYIDEESNNRGAAGYENLAQVSSNVMNQSPELARNRQKPGMAKVKSASRGSRRPSRRSSRGSARAPARR